jgi:hypothetical protein
MMSNTSERGEQEVLVLRDPAGHWYMLPRDEAERWRLSDEQQAEIGQQLQQSDVVGYAAIGAPSLVAFGTVAPAQVISPRDVATGQASGKRMHGAITIIKEWGSVR